jgi:hypothetical protein
VIGSNATDLVHIGQALMDRDNGLDFLVSAVFNYPTLAEAYKVAGPGRAQPPPRLRLTSRAGYQRR